MSTKLIYGRPLAEKIYSYIIKETSVLQYQLTSKIRPKLAILQVGDLNESNIYIKRKVEAAKLLNFDCLVIKLSHINATENEILQKIYELNTDSTVHGIMLQMPLNSTEIPNRFRCINFVDKSKDIEGMNDFNVSALFNACIDKAFVPPTAAACLSIVTNAGWSLKGLKVTVIGRGLTSGRPISNLMLCYGSTVTVCHRQTSSLENQLQTADLVISACGKPWLIKGAWIKTGAGIIDCGIHRHKDQIIGDIDISQCINKFSWATPVPGGIGPLTVAWLLQNLFENYRRYIGCKHRSFPEQFVRCMGETQNVPLVEYIDSIVR